MFNGVLYTHRCFRTKVRIDFLKIKTGNYINLKFLIYFKTNDFKWNKEGISLKIRIYLYNTYIFFRVKLNIDVYSLILMNAFKKYLLVQSS